LKKANDDHAKIEADYQRQYRAYHAYYGEDPTDDQLVSADMALLPEEFHTEMNDFAEAMHMMLDQPMPDEVVTQQPTEDWEDIEDEIEVLPVPVDPNASLGGVTGGDHTAGDTMHVDDTSSVAPGIPSSPSAIAFNQPEFAPETDPTSYGTSSPYRPSKTE